MTDWKLALKKTTIKVYTVLEPLLARLGFNTKEAYELAYWTSRRLGEGKLRNEFYEAIFTTHAGLTSEFYAGKKMLDVGCGPRGSLEWGDMLAERVGLDPLVDEYRRLGIEQHEMQYVDAPAENIPFADGYFDVVSTVNSLDHVEDVDLAIRELKRVTASGGSIILMVEIATKPTIAEPHVFDWSIVQKFSNQFDVIYEKHLEQNPEQRGLMAALEYNQPFDHDNPTERDGFLIVRFQKR